MNTFIVCTYNKPFVINSFHLTINYRFPKVQENIYFKFYLVRYITLIHIEG